MNSPLTSLHGSTQPFARGGEVGRLLRAIDWTETGLGPIEAWPAELRDALTLLLPTGAQMVLFWGPERRAFYNDNYAALLRDQHPAALGQPADVRWHKVWKEFGPMIDGVFDTGDTLTLANRRFDFEVDGRAVTMHFDLSLSAVMLADGSVGGVLGIISDMTERMRAVAQMAHDRARLRQMFDDAPGFIAVLRVPDYVVELANNTYRRMVGGRTLVGRPYAQALPEVAALGFIDLLDEVVRTGQPFVGTDMAVQLPTATDGETQPYWIDFICQPLTDGDGVVTGIFIEGIDQTERHRAEADLVRGRLALEQATEAGEVAIWSYDVERDLFRCSQSGLRFMGAPPELGLMTRLQFRDFVAPADQPMMMAAFENTIDPARRAPFDIDYRVCDPATGQVRWLSARGRALFEGDTCVRVTGTLLDNTARRQQAEEWRESEERFRTLADGLPALVWMTEPDGRISFASEGFREILGVAPEAVVENGWLPLLPPEFRADAAKSRLEWLRTPERLSGEYPVLRADGGEIWVHAESRPRFVGGDYRGHTSCAIDVTSAHLAGERLEARIAERTAELTLQIAERERVEETLHQMQRLEAIGQLTSGVAHDFNNLLTVILGNVDALERASLREAFDRRVVQRLDHIRAAAERGATLTQQLLAFSRRQRLEAKVVDLNETVAGLSDLIRSTLGRSIAVETHLAKGVWPALVDPTQIELIILNLAINARDAMPGGGRLRVATANVTRDKSTDELPAGDYVCVSVRDAGTGMSEAVLARAFEPFFTTKEVGKGSGLGLAQVYGFARQSGGGARIDSVVGEGTVVSVYLPRAQDVASNDTSPPTSLPRNSIEGRTVLVLDDEDRVRAVAVEVLREAGCRVIEACDGAAALEALAQEPEIDLVVADVAMPVMTGFEFAQRAARERPELPVLFVTGYVDLGVAADVPEERLVRKPYARRLLLDRVRHLLAA